MGDKQSLQEGQQRCGTRFTCGEAVVQFPEPWFYSCCVHYGPLSYTCTHYTTHTGGPRLHCSRPQLVLQLSLFMRGTLTLPVVSLLHQTSNTTGLQPHPDHQDQPLTLFGRDYDVEDRYYLGLIQLGSILCSLLSVLTSVLHFNELET